MKSSIFRGYGEDFFKHLLKRYRITKIDKHSCKLVSRRTNMTWKIEVLPHKFEA